MSYYDDLLKNISASGQNWSQWDLDLASKNQQFADTIYSAKAGYAGAKTPEDRTYWNNVANNARNQFGNYTGGSTGGSYISGGPNQQGAYDTRDKIGSFGDYNSQYSGYQNQLLDSIVNYQPFSYNGAAPVYSNPYSGTQQQMLDAVTNYAPFSYDKNAPIYNNQYAAYQQQLLDAVINRAEFEWSKENDPLWSPYKKSYLREGDRATSNAMAQASVRTGGRPSSYAMTAAGQAGDYYATKLNDVIPQLYEQAYNKYLQEYQMKLSDLGAVNTQEQMDYSKYLTDLGQFNTDRSFSYNNWLDQYNMNLSGLNAANTQDQLDYNKYLSDLSQYNTDRNFSYNNWLDQYNMNQSGLSAVNTQDQMDYNRYLDDYSRLLSQNSVYRDMDASDYARQQDALNWQQQSFNNAYNMASLLGTVPDRWADSLRVDPGTQTLDYNSYLNSVLNNDRTWALNASNQFGGALTDEWANTLGLPLGTKTMDQQYQDAQLARMASSGGGSGGGTTMSGTAAMQAFMDGDHSDEVIAAMVENGISEQEITRRGYTGNYFNKQPAARQDVNTLVDRFTNGDYSDEVIAGMINAGYTYSELIGFDPNLAAILANYYQRMNVNNMHVWPIAVGAKP